MSKRIISTVLVVFMLTAVFAGCGNSLNSGETQATGQATSQATEAVTEVENADPYGKYEQTVTFTLGRADIANNQLPEGDTLENNAFTRYIKDKLNVEIKHAWVAQGDAYAQKVALSIASNDIPDVMFINQLSTLNSLVESDIIEDLTEAYDQYGSPLLKEYYASAGTNAQGVLKALETPTFKGSLMALPDLNTQANAITQLWIRQDWMDKLQLQAPRSIDDIILIAKAFIERDPDGNNRNDTVGLTGSADLLGINMHHVFNSIFTAYHAYPRQWLKDNAGNTVYGSVLPEVKTALAKLNEMYSAGVIDKEFATRKQDDTNALIASGKAGMMFGPWWSPWWPLTDTVKNDSKAEWSAYMAPVDAEGKFISTMQPINNSFIVVKKGYANPEAVVKVLNTQQRVLVWKDPDVTLDKQLYPKDLGYTVDWGNWPFTLSIEYIDAVEKRAKQIKDVLDGNSSPDSLDQAARGWYDLTVQEKANPKKDLNAWSHSAVVLSGARSMAFTDITKVYSEFYGTTETMETKKATLDKLENETFLKIILGSAPIEEFDKFVTQWKQLGGDEITKEVDNYVKSK